MNARAKPASSFASTPPEAPLRQTLALARPAAGRLALATLLGAGSIAAAIGLIATSAWLISRSSQRPPESAVAVAIVGVQFFALSRGLCRYFERLVGHDAALRVLSGLRVSVYERLERLAPLGLPAFRSGELLSRLVQDVDSLQDVLLRVVPPFAIALLVGAGTVALVWSMLPAAALILLVALLIAGVLVPWTAGTLAARGEAMQARARGALSASVVDLIEGAPELVAYGAASEQLRRTLLADAELTRIARAGARTAGIGQGLTTLCSGLAMWGALLVGVGAVRAGRMDGVLLAGIALIPLVAFELVSGLPGAAQALQRVRRAGARLQEVLDAPAPVAEPRRALTVEHARVEDRPLDTPPNGVDRANGNSPYGHAPGSPSRAVQAHTVRASGLGCSYPGAPHAALANVNLELTPGRRVALVGESGAGKSTLAGVLLRFLPYEHGSLTLDGIELDRLDGDEVRRTVGLLGQDAHVFDSTIEENLRIAKRAASEAELREALARARLLDWVDGLPEGLSTEVGERGQRMSGGQRQRLALARVLLADFPVLILDEPGEHLDTATADALVADALRGAPDRATLLISHRLAGLERVDEVLVMGSSRPGQCGEILERGTHEQLLASCGQYAEWFRREMGNGVRG